MTKVVLHPEVIGRLIVHVRNRSAKWLGFQHFKDSFLDLRRKTHPYSDTKEYPALSLTSGHTMAPQSFSPAVQSPKEGETTFSGVCHLPIMVSPELNLSPGAGLLQTTAEACASTASRREVTRRKPAKRRQSITQFSKKKKKE